MVFFITTTITMPPLVCFLLVLPEVLLKTCLVSADEPGHPVYHLNLHLKSDQ